MIAYFVMVIIGIILGIIIDRKFFKKETELGTDEILKILKDKGYWVRIGPRDDLK